MPPLSSQLRPYIDRIATLFGEAERRRQAEAESEETAVAEPLARLRRLREAVNALCEQWLRSPAGRGR